MIRRPVALVYAATLPAARGFVASPLGRHLLAGFRVLVVSSRSHARARGFELELVVELDELTPAALESIVPATVARPSLWLVRRSSGDE